VKKVSKAILIALGVLLVIVAVLVLGVNLYIQSAGTQARIQRGLGRALHTPVKIASLSFMPWYGLKAAGITVQDGNAGANENTIQIAAISARIQLWMLLRGTVVIKELTIDKPTVSWTQTPEGKWQLPLQQAPSESEVPQAVVPAAPEGTPQVQPTEQSQPSPSAAPAPQPPGLNNVAGPSISHVRLRDASFDFNDRNHKQIVSVSGIYMQSPHPTAESVDGTALISQITIRDLFFMRHCASEFHYSPSQFSLVDARSVIAGGASEGSLSVQTAQPDSPFSLDVKYSNIQIEQLLAEAGIADTPASGLLAGFLHLKGNLRTSAAATGTGQIVITSGRISHIELLTQLGTFLHTDRLQQFDIQEAQANYHLADGKIYVDQVTLKAADLSVSGAGTIEMTGGALLLKCRLSMGANITRQIPEVLMENFGRDEVTNTRYMDFNVFNTISSPRTDLLTLIRRNLEHGAKNIWKSIFGAKQNVQPFPVPAPAATPAFPSPAP